MAFAALLIAIVALVVAILAVVLCVMAGVSNERSLGWYGVQLEKHGRDIERHGENLSKLSVRIDGINATLGSHDPSRTACGCPDCIEERMLGAEHEFSGMDGSETDRRHLILWPNVWRMTERATLNGCGDGEGKVVTLERASIDKNKGPMRMMISGDIASLIPPDMQVGAFVELQSQFSYMEPPPFGSYPDGEQAPSHN